VSSDPRNANALRAKVLIIEVLDLVLFFPSLKHT
jgi:hypothetical protein